MQRHNRGFSYVLLLAVLVTGSIMAGVTASVTSTYVQRDKENELLFRGLQYRRAIESYYHAGVPAAYPRSLNDLLLDPRFVHRVHLRRRYADPFASGGADWLLITNEQGGIMGVASSSTKNPLKVGNFPAGLQLAQGQGYQTWQFIYLPQPSSLPGSGVMEQNTF